MFPFQSSCDKEVILNVLGVLTDLLSLGKEAKLWGNACGRGAERGSSNRSGNLSLCDLGQVFARPTKQVIDHQSLLSCIWKRVFSVN